MELGVKVDPQGLMVSLDHEDQEESVVQVVNQENQVHLDL